MTQDNQISIYLSIHLCTSPLLAEGSQQQRSRRGPAAFADAGDCPTNAHPDKIRVDLGSLAGGGLYQVSEAHGDDHSISSLHLFNLPLHGGSDLAYDLSADPAKVVASYREGPTDPSLQLDGLIPLLEAAGRAPVELPALDAWLPDCSASDPEAHSRGVAIHNELAALIVEEGERARREIGASPRGLSVCLL